MAFNVTVTGFGSFTATVNGEQAVLAAEVMDASALMATMAVQGPKGDKGDPGDAATIAVGTVTTLTPGDPATVVNVGTSVAAVFDFGIPQGAQGIQGIQGPQGIPGVVAATAPLAYDSGTQTVSISNAPSFISVRMGAGIFKPIGETPTYPDDFQFVAYKPDAVLLKADNLLGLTNTGTARSNLGLGTMAVETASDYLAKAGNLSGLASTSTARTNLDVYSKAESDALVPAASTTVAGKVELATDAEAVAGTSTATVVTPSGIYLNRVSPGMGLLPGNVSVGITSGTGAASNASMFGITCFGPDAGVIGYGGRRFQMNNGQIGSLEQGWGVVDFDKRISLSFRIAPQLVSSGSPHNDSVINVNYGDLLGTDTGGTLARKGFGIQIYGHNNPLRLTIHDGTTYRTVDSSFTPVSTTTASAIDFLLVSEAGNVTLYNRTTRAGGWTQIATSANGPTGLSASNANSVTCTSRNESTSVTSVRWRTLAGFFSVDY
ncbi:MAG: hypothetical protein ACK5VI_09975 [Opitutia bacterium]